MDNPVACEVGAQNKMVDVLAAGLITRGREDGDDVLIARARGPADESWVEQLVSSTSCQPICGVTGWNIAGLLRSDQEPSEIVVES